jgi:hypothetical protein
MEAALVRGCDWQARAGAGEAPTGGLEAVFRAKRI